MSTEATGTTTVAHSYSQIWPAMLANFLALRVWEGTGAIQDDIYRDSPDSAVSISAVFDLVRFTNSTKQH